MNKYTLEKVVGEGSFGKALLCRRNVDSKKCIIKQISLAKMSRKEAAQTEQESSLLARLKHPNIVTFWESFSEASKGVSYLWIVMEFADGGDLSNLIKNRRGQLISESQVLQLFVQISLAMKHVHDRKILHRDLKAQNIFLTKSGIIKLGDFGIARVLRNTGELACTQIGTPYYMSPEIMDNKRYNSKTDIWSLGCVLYELLTLKVPFEGASMRQLVQNIIKGQYRPVSSQYSQPLRDLVAETLAKDPKKRPGINSLLSRPVIRDKISNFLDNIERNNEFSHTILHGEDILKKAALPVAGVPPQAPSNPTSGPTGVAAPVRGEPVLFRGPPPAAPAPVQPPNARPASRGGVPPPSAGEVDRLKAEAEKMRLKIDQITKERNAAVEAERKRLEILKEKERMEIHKLQLEREAREKLRREEKARRQKELEARKAEEAARHIREAKEAAERRRAERDRPWAQLAAAAVRPQDPKLRAAANPAVPAWLANPNSDRRGDRVSSPSNMVRDASPRNPSPSPFAFAVEDDSDQYMKKLKARLKEKDDERRNEKKLEMDRIREKERMDRDRRDQDKAQREQLERERDAQRKAAEDAKRAEKQADLARAKEREIAERKRREHDRLEQARLGKERAVAEAKRDAERKEAEKRKQEDLEERLREQRLAEHNRLEGLRVEKEKLRARAEEVRQAEKKKIAEQNLEKEKEKQRIEKAKLSKRLEDREKDRQRREQERERRARGRPADPPAARVHAGSDAEAPGDLDSSDDERSGAHKVRPYQEPSPLGGKRGALKLDWLSNLESEMGALKGEIEKMSPHFRGGGTPAGRSPYIAAASPSPAGPTDNRSNIQFFKKNERPQISDSATPPAADPAQVKSIGVRSSASAKSPGGPAPISARSNSSASGNTPPSAVNGAKKPCPSRKGPSLVSLSVDDIEEIPPWRKKDGRVDGGRKQVAAKGRKGSAPPSLAGESSSVVSLDERKHKREKDRSDLKQFLMAKRNNKGSAGPPSGIEESASVFSVDDRREKREKERSELRQFLAEKRNHKRSFLQDDVSVVEAVRNMNHLSDEAPKTSAHPGRDRPASERPDLYVEDSEVDVIELKEKPADVVLQSRKPSGEPDGGLSITIENNNAVAEAPRSAKIEQSAAAAMPSKHKSGFSVSKILSNLFGPKKKIIPGVSPKVRLQSPHIKIASPRKKPHKSPKGAPAWLVKDNVLADYESANAVIEIEDDPKSWSSEVICANTSNFDMETGPLPSVGALAASSEYQELLDSMRLALDDVNAHAVAAGSRHHRDVDRGHKQRLFEMGAIVEEADSEVVLGDEKDPKGDVDGEGGCSDDETFEESSLSDENGDGEENDQEMNSDWSVDEVDEGEGEEESSNNLNKDFAMEEKDGNKNVSSGMKNTLFGAPISLSASMKDELSAFSSYGPAVRIETLRIVLEDRLGEGPFLEAYRYLKSVKDRVPLDDEAAEDAEEERLLADVERVVGTDGLRYLDLLYELITAEDNF